MELQKMDSQGKGWQQSLSAAIKNDGSFDLAKIDKIAVSTELRKFKTTEGGINYPALFSIPKEKRIAAMAKNNFPETSKIISVAIASALEGMNFTQPMTSNQIFDLAEAIIDDADSDNLSMEDLLLFLQELVRGKYDDSFGRMDVAQFMRRFDVYRDRRWEAGIKIRDEKHEEFKRLGDDNYHERANRVSPIDEELLKYTKKRQEQKDEIALLKKENEILKRRNE